MLRIEGQPILTAAQMRAAEERAAPTPEAMDALMERAGAGVADAVRRVAAGAEVLVLCGPGNNGGDGYVAARVLREQGVPVRVAASAEARSDLARRARQGWDGRVDALFEASPAPVLVDALFGTGLVRPLEQQTVHALDRLQVQARFSVAVDLPSGVEADTGARLGPRATVGDEGETLPFDLTLALGALKPAHLLFPAARECGAVRVVDLGIAFERDSCVFAPPQLHSPGPDAHKYTRGVVAVVAGSMPGAGALTAIAAGRGGAGYVLLLGSTTDRLPHAVVRRRWSPSALDDHRIDVLLVGPGLGRDDAAREKLAAALASPRPLVLDGDALRLVDLATLAARPVMSVLTPHDGEFMALFGDLPGSRFDRARAAARASRATVVMKGATTIVADPNGRMRATPPASAWLSTAGTGDVLAGLVAARLAARPHLPLAAAGEALWLHAEAARRAGPGFLADDLAAHLPAAMAACL